MPHIKSEDYLQPTRSSFVEPSPCIDRRQLLARLSSCHVRQHSILYATILVYLSLCWTLAGWAGHLDRFTLLIYSKTVAMTSLSLAACFVAVVAIRIMVVERPARLTRAIISELRTRWLTAERLIQGIPLILLFMMFMSCFSSMKSMIPIFQPYAWDPVFHHWDKTLHFGLEPWRITHSLLGGDFATFAMNFVYNLWFPIMFGVLYWQVFTLRDRVRQQRFLVSFYLCWIINGTILASALSSAGPAFYGQLFPGDPYSALMQTLHAINERFGLFALSTQDMLWNTYQNNRMGFGSGISAMPSMHVSIACLLMLFSFGKQVFWRYFFSVFFVLILIGSVHLAWHYAVDAYVAIITTILIWYLTGKLYRDRPALD